MKDDPSSWELAAAIISMGRALHVEVVAEGVEHLYQLNRLRELGCEFAQGYYLSRPLRAERIEALLDAPGTTPPRLWAARPRNQPRVERGRRPHGRLDL